MRLPVRASLEAEAYAPYRPGKVYTPSKPDNGLAAESAAPSLALLALLLVVAVLLFLAMSLG